MNQEDQPSLERLQQIKAVIFDCDGVLTDGGLYYSDGGERLLRFHARDGFAFALARKFGLKTAILSGRPIDIAEHRYKELGVHPCIGRCFDKQKGVLKVCADLEIAPKDVAFVADDLPDLPAFTEVGLRIAVADACPDIIAVADWVLETKGGQGAAREVLESILRSRSDWQAWQAPFLAKLTS